MESSESSESSDSMAFLFGTWTLASQTYGNGDAWRYTYNEFDDLVSAYTTGGSTGTELKYFYNSEGALARIEQYDTTLSGTSISARTLVSTERYYYDTTDRMVRITRTDVDGDTYECSWEYDSNNNVTELVETINGTPTTTAYTYDADQRVKSIATGGTTTTYNYDGFGRISTQVTTNGSTTVLTDSYNYREPGSGLTSTQVEKLAITAGGYSVTYQYEYDANGNITSVSDGAYSTSYVYDALNQLTRENNEAAGKTWVWTYDAGGNITSRTEYAYTIGTLGTAQDTITYTYGDSAWGDLLTAYNETEISHDGIGNPLSDGTWTYTWDGRQLASMTGNGAAWSYKYDSDGLRTERSDGTTTYKYVYSGNSLVHMSVGSNLLYFTYDGSVPMTVTYNGTVYYYVTNLQGDVIAILDGSGTAVVQYTYDAWGKILTTTGTLAETLGVHNPLRYRGYVWDTETTLYYLQSRYYDPEIGRFINADAFASTGQGLLGNNMFAYCLNNPVSYTDPTGHCSCTLSGRLDSNFTFAAMCSCGGGTVTNDFKKTTRLEYLVANESETIVLNAERFAFYKGAIVLRHSNDFLTSWSLFGIIFLNRNVSSEETLKHEYGHYLQEREYGCVKYISAVFVPSATYNLLSRYSTSLSANYYNMPWEYNADIRGDVNREHATWSETVSTVYFIIQRFLP